MPKPAPMLAESQRWLIRSPAMPLPYSHHLRHGKDRSASKARGAALAMKRAQSIVCASHCSLLVVRLQTKQLGRTPDAFLTHQWHLDESLVMSRLRAQITDCGKELRSHLVCRPAQKFKMGVKARQRGPAPDGGPPPPLAPLQIVKN